MNNVIPHITVSDSVLLAAAAAAKFEHFEELDLMELIYDLKQSKLPEDKPLLEAAQRELERRRAQKTE